MYISLSTGTTGTITAQSVITPILNLPVTASSAYSTGFVVGSVFQFGDIPGLQVPPFEVNGTLTSVNVSSASTQTSKLKLYIFAEGPAASTLNDFAPPVVLPSDLSTVIGIVELEPDNGLASGTVWSATNVDIELFNWYTTPLYGVLITDGTLVFNSTSDLNITMIVTE